MRNTCKSDEVVVFGLLSSGGRVSNTWMTYPEMGDTAQKCALRPHELAGGDASQESFPGDRGASLEGSAAD